MIILGYWKRISERDAPATAGFNQNQAAPVDRGTAGELQDVWEAGQPWQESSWDPTVSETRGMAALWPGGEAVHCSSRSQDIDRGEERTGGFTAAAWYWGGETREGSPGQWDCDDGQHGDH